MASAVSLSGWIRSMTGDLPDPGEVPAGRCGGGRDVGSTMAETLHQKGGAMRLLGLAAPLAAGLLLATALNASASVSAPVLVSGPSPYAGCASSDAGQPGHEYPNGEAEPYVAVDR
jgi:hypothetical protein